MRRKLLILFVMIFAFSVCFSACMKKTGNTEKNLDYLKSLDTYSCNFKMKIQNDKQTLEYSGKQYYNKNYGYKFELDKDRIMLYRENKIYVKDLHNGLKYDTENEFDSVFKLSFIGEFIGLIYTNEKINTYFKNVNNIKHQVIEVDIPSNNKNINKAQLYVEAENALPKYLIIYDNKNKEKVKVEYNNFDFNPQLDEKIFQIQ